jgi:RAD51-like protein 2
MDFNEDEYPYDDDQVDFGEEEEQQPRSQLDTLQGIPASVIQKLRDNGYHSFGDLVSQTALALSKECGISQKEALSIIRQAKSANSDKSKHETTTTTTAITKAKQPNAAIIKTQSAYDAFQKQKDRKSITTMCKEVDIILHGGIPMGQTTEISGVPGVGKTQLAMQLAVNVQIPQELGGCGGECLYIDTEGSFFVERLEQIAHATIDTIHQQTTDETKKQHLEKFTIENVLDGVKYFRLYNLLEQLAFVQILEEYVKQHNIKLLIFDTIGFHFRHDQSEFGDYTQRQRILLGITQRLSQISNDHNVAVVCLNQITTKIDRKDSSQSYLCPAVIVNSNNQLFLEFERGERYLRVNKGVNMSTAKEKYVISRDGFRSSKKTSSDQSSTESRKRPREE